MPVIPATWGAEAAGADIVGGDELIAEVEKGMLDFDAAIATPQFGLFAFNSARSVWT